MREQPDRAPSTNSAVAITRDEDNNGRHERALPPMPFSEAFSAAFREHSQMPPRSAPGDANARYAEPSHWLAPFSPRFPLARALFACETRKQLLICLRKAGQFHLKNRRIAFNSSHAIPFPCVSFHFDICLALLFGDS